MTSSLAVCGCSVKKIARKARKAGKARKGKTIEGRGQKTVVRGPWSVAQKTKGRGQMNVDCGLMKGARCKVQGKSSQESGVRSQEKSTKTRGLHPTGY